MNCDDRSKGICDDIEETERDIIDRIQACNRCRMCVAMCPTFEGWYRQSAFGRLSAVNLHFKYGLGTVEELSRLLFECANCRRCQERCRVLSRNIGPSDIILKARQLLVKKSQAKNTKGS
jgi:Fe-S oxidoreductase